MQSRQTILVVDGIGINRLLPGLILRPFGFKVLECVSGERSLKDLYSGAKLSEKALRTRMREFEKNGVIESAVCLDDGRAKYLMPTEKFYEAIYLHAQEAKRIFQKNFLMIDK
jgi:DNA-binding MarR family transcriptional regulator